MSLFISSLKSDIAFARSDAVFSSKMPYIASKASPEVSSEVIGLISVGFILYTIIFIWVLILITCLSVHIEIQLSTGYCLVPCKKELVVASCSVLSVLQMVEASFSGEYV